MDALRELEEFQRPTGPEAPSEPARKRQRAPESRGAASKAAVEAAELLAQAERELEESQVEVSALDENEMKAMVLAVEKRINDNMTLRMKYPDKPDRFMDSELELFSHLKRLHALATAPELYPTFVRTKCVPSLLSLLAHENSDISMDVVDLLHELTDADGAAEHDVGVLVEALLEHGALLSLVDHMKRLDEASDEEAAAVHATLAVFEAVVDAKPEAAAQLAREAGLMQWLLARLKLRPFHANKLYATELLAVLQQQNPANQVLLGELDGVLALLTAASHYKRKEPQGLEEAELVENIFDCLAAALTQPANQTLFLKAEGIELMVLTIKERRYASHGALRALDAALARNGANCERFVDIRGFKTLFPMIGAASPPLPAFAKAEKRAAQQTHDEKVASLLCTLLQQLTGDRRLRLLGKLAEDGFSKLDRLIALRFDYAQRVALAESAAFAYGGHDTAGGADDDDEALEEKAYLARSEAGLFTLQLIDSVVCYAAAAKSKPLRARTLQMLYEGGGSLHDAWANAEELIRTVYAADAELAGGETGRGADAAQRRAMAEMEEGVQALLAKYQASSEGVGEGVPALEEDDVGQKPGKGGGQAAGAPSALPPHGV